MKRSCSSLFSLRIKKKTKQNVTKQQQQQQQQQQKHEITLLVKKSNVSRSINSRHFCSTSTAYIKMLIHALDGYDLPLRRYVIPSDVVFD